MSPPTIANKLLAHLRPCSRNGFFTQPKTNKNPIHLEPFIIYSKLMCQHSVKFTILVISLQNDQRQYSKCFHVFYGVVQYHPLSGVSPATHTHNTTQQYKQKTEQNKSANNNFICSAFISVRGSEARNIIHTVWMWLHSCAKYWW